MNTKRVIVDIAGYSALVGILVDYNRIERHDDYLAVAVAILLLIPVGVIWRRLYARHA